MDYLKFNEILSNENAAMFIKMHYHHESNNNYLLDKSFSNIILLEENDVSDINTILPFVDILISDYSGVVLDYLILDRPIIPTSFDLEEYITKDRELYEDYAKNLNRQLSPEIVRPPVSAPAPSNLSLFRDKSQVSDSQRAAQVLRQQEMRKLLGVD